MNSHVLSKVKHFIAKHQLLSDEGRWLVALSGGADSVSLLLILKNLGYSIEAIHCNFNLRGEESFRDEQFCIDLCRQESVLLHRVHFDTRQYAVLHHQSLEMAARHLRYHYFEQLRGDIGAAGICVAHHQEDSVETILINLIRGTGVKGLTGIKPKNGFIIRPLLCLTRSEIETFLHSRQQNFVIDSTNMVNDVVRNKIRLDVIPLLKEINPSVQDSILSTAYRLAELEKIGESFVESFREAHVRQQGATMLIDKVALLETPSPAYTVFILLYGMGFTASQLDDMLACARHESGRVFTTATHQLLVDREHFILEPVANDDFHPIKLPETGLYVIDENTSLRVEQMPVSEMKTISRDSRVAMLDARKVKWPLLLRRVETGERFQPFGMQGTKLLSDFMTDAKLNVFEKRRQLVVADGMGRVVWLVAMRPDHRFCITSETQEVLILTWKG